MEHCTNSPRGEEEGNARRLALGPSQAPRPPIAGQFHFHCYEMMLLKHLQQDQKLWKHLCEVLGTRTGEQGQQPGTEATGTTNNSSSNNIEKLLIGHRRGPDKDLWFFSVTICSARDKLVHFVRREVKRMRAEGEEERDGEMEQREKEMPVFSHQPTLLSRYLRTFQFVEMHLDNINCPLTLELFRDCPNVELLSLRCNYLRGIPPEIGRMSKLKKLFLTNNCLQNRSIPYTLTFCKKLEELYLDHNLLDALPGFLIDMDSLKTVHRHGNHNYFKATFMWYHTDINDRILEAPGWSFAGLQDTEDQRERVEEGEETRAQENKLRELEHSLEFLCIKSIISSRTNFLSASAAIPPRLQAKISELCDKFNLCGNCSAVEPVFCPGYKVYTFKNPYLGNYCVPFLHWACSYECAQAIEVPARLEQLKSAQEQDRLYQRYVREAMLQLRPNQRSLSSIDEGLSNYAATTTTSSSTCKKAAPGSFTEAKDEKRSHPSSSCQIL